MLWLLLLSWIILFNQYDTLNTKRFNISQGVVNARAIVLCDLSINIYSSFNLNEIHHCTNVFIEKNHIELIHVNVSQVNRRLNVNSSPERTLQPKILIKHANSSFVHSPNININIDKYYLSFSSELMCRYSIIENEIICFYCPLAKEFFELEKYFDRTRKTTSHLRSILKLIYVIMSIFIIIICISLLVLLCQTHTTRHRSTLLEFAIDPQLIYQTELKLGPETV